MTRESLCQQKGQMGHRPHELEEEGLGKSSHLSNIAGPDWN